MRALRVIRFWACLGSLSCATAAAGPDAVAVVTLPTVTVREPAGVVGEPTVVSQPALAAPPAPPTPTGGPSLDHKPCDTRSPGTAAVDINGDGKPDVFKVSSGGKLVCRASDLTFDGVVDAYNYFAPNGTEERVERDLDGDGKVDAIVFRVDGGASCVDKVFAPRRFAVSLRVRFAAQLLKRLPCFLAQNRQVPRIQAQGSCHISTQLRIAGGDEQPFAPSTRS